MLTLHKKADSSIKTYFLIRCLKCTSCADRQGLPGVFSEVTSHLLKVCFFFPTNRDAVLLWLSNSRLHCPGSFATRFLDKKWAQELYVKFFTHVLKKGPQCRTLLFPLLWLAVMEFLKLTLNATCWSWQSAIRLAPSTSVWRRASYSNRNNINN